MFDLSMNFDSVLPFVFCYVTAEHLLICVHDSSPPYQTSWSIGTRTGFQVNIIVNDFFTSTANARKFKPKRLLTLIIYEALNEYR